MNKPALFVLCFAPLITACLPAVSQAAAPPVFARSTQMIVVVTPGWDTVEGRLERFERDDPHESWRSVGEPIPIDFLCACEPIAIQFDPLHDSVVP